MTAESFFQLAIKNIQQRKYEAAIDAFMRSLAQKENWQTYLYLGKTLHTLKQYQYAIEAFNNSLALKEDWKSYQELGRTLSKIDKHRPAVDALNKSIALKKDAQTYQLLGSILDKLGEKEKATRACRILSPQHGIRAHTHRSTLGGKRGVTIREQIDDITNTLMQLFSFHPSFYTGESEKTTRTLETYYSSYQNVPEQISKDHLQDLRQPWQKKVTTTRETLNSIARISSGTATSRKNTFLMVICQKN